MSRTIIQSIDFKYSENGVQIKRFKETDLNIGDKIIRNDGIISEVTEKTVTDDEFIIIRWNDMKV